MWIDENTLFDADLIDNQIVGIAADVGQHDSGMHQHKKDQLLYAPVGCISITLDNKQCVLPPTEAAWIPAGTRHCARMRNVVAYRSLYLAHHQWPNLPNEVMIFSVTPLLKALIERMAFWDWDKAHQTQVNTVALFCEELNQAETTPLQLPLPVDKRLTHWLASIHEQQLEPEPLITMSKRIGASGKTISRIFQKETGMPYQAWRQQWRLLTAIERLAENKSVSQVAHSLSFSSDSAFISFFRQHTGQTPSQYIHKKQN